jgi:hypothetical protein
VAVGATTGPSPARNVCTAVSVTLNGVVTVTRGAAVSVEPVTPTPPVAPLRVHSGAPPSPGAWVGQLSAVAGWGEAGDTASVKAGALVEAEDVSFDEAGLSELHAASVMTADAAQTTSPTEEYVREEFTVVTLQSRVSHDVLE